MDSEQKDDGDTKALTLREAVEQGLAIPNLFHPDMDENERKKYTTTSGIVVGQAAHEVVEGIFNEELPYVERVARGGLGLAGLFEFFMAATKTMHMKRDIELERTAEHKRICIAEEAKQKDTEIEELKKQIDELKKKN